MDTLTLFLLFLVIALIVILIAGAIYFLSKQPKGNEASQNIIQELNRVREELARSDAENRREMQAQLNRMQDELSNNARASHIASQNQSESMRKQSEHMTNIVGDIAKRLTEIDKTNRQVLDYSGQLENLQNILKNPKHRGVLGEFWLESLLSNFFPNRDMYVMQYTILDGEGENKLIADAVIKMKGMVIPIDAKFSLENFNRIFTETDPAKREALEKQFKADVKKRVDETSKYVRPDLGTTDFAFMYVPAEGVYYNLINADVGSGVNSHNLLEYAFQKRVMIVSPTNFYGYLQTIIMGLNSLKIEKSAEEIRKHVGELGRHMKSYADYYNKIGKNLGTVVNQYTAGGKELTKISKDVIRITKGSADDIIEIDAVDKPLLE